MYRTDQTTTSDSIVTTFIIPSGSANGEIDQAVLVGGDTATITPGTGIEVETHSFIYTKNSLESLQLQFTSINDLPEEINNLPEELVGFKMPIGRMFYSF
jgi:hypothetical protein